MWNGIASLLQAAPTIPGRPPELGVTLHCPQAPLSCSSQQLQPPYNPQPRALPSLQDLGIRVLFCNLLQVFFSLPFLSEACLGFCSTLRLERAARLLWKSCFPCHMTSVGYIATFHMAAQTQTVVFMKILLIQTWSLPGTRGSFLGCGVFCLEEQLTEGGVEGQLLCLVHGGGGEGGPSQECGASWAAPSPAPLREVIAARSQRCFLFFDSGAGWVWVRGKGKGLVEGIRTPVSGCPVADLFCALR